MGRDLLYVGVLDHVFCEAIGYLVCMFVESESFQKNDFHGGRSNCEVRSVEVGGELK